MPISSNPGMTSSRIATRSAFSTTSSRGAPCPASFASSGYVRGASRHIRRFAIAIAGSHAWTARRVRFRTEKAIPQWFVALDETGDAIEGVEGMACSGEKSWCRPPTRCVYDRNITTCNEPKVAQRGEGCDSVGTRPCVKGLTCLPTRQCGNEGE